jgi:hypothetical protein
MTVPPWGTVLFHCLLVVVTKEHPEKGGNRHVKEYNKLATLYTTRA